MLKYLALALPLLLAAPAMAEEIDGTYDNTLDNLYAVTQPGSRAPEGDSYCEETFGKMKGAHISGTYKINTETLMMIASAYFDGVETTLNPLGIQSVYAFMGFPDGGKPQRIIFDLSLDQSTKESDVLYLGNDMYNCILSNMPAN